MPETEKKYCLVRLMLLVVSEPSAIESGSRVAEVHIRQIGHISNHHVEQSLSYEKSSNL